MNTYSETFNSTVRALLSTLESEQKILSSQKDMALTARDCAKKAIVSAHERSAAINSLMLSQQRTMEKLQDNRFISSAVLSSANEANTRSKLSITNTAVAAANIQVAANAIVRLASDAGSLYNIATAVDYDSEMYLQIKTINELMNSTAYNAEISSRLAMEASALTSEIDSATVADKANNTNTQVANLLNLMTGQYNTTKEQQQMIASELNKAIDAGKQVQEELEKISTEHAAAQEACLFATKELNLNLQVQVSDKTPDRYTVSFEEYTDPFPDDPSKKDHDPVESYYIFLIRDEKKEAFSLSNAMECINKPGQFTQLKKRANSTKTRFEKEIAVSGLFDADGKPMKTEQAYVIVLMVELKDEYKKRLNDFDNILTAPSVTFTLRIPVNGTVTDHTISKKEQELYALEVEALYAQQKVDQHQEMVTALTQQSALRAQQLAVRAVIMAQALNNKSLADQLVNSALDLKNNSQVALNTATVAEAKAAEMAQHSGTVANQLICIAKVMDKLHKLLIRKKALNPLISDELTELATVMSKNAANAVSLKLVALKTAFTAHASNVETKTVMGLGYAQAYTLYEALAKEEDAKKSSVLTLQETIHSSYEQFLAHYNSAETMHNKTTEKLNSSTAKLNTAQAALRSFESGLAAAKAAVFR